MTAVWEFITSNPILAASAIIVASFIAAFLVRFITTNVFRALAVKTATTLDDQIVDAISRPLLLTVILVGISLAVRQIAMGASGLAIFDSIILTLGILLWTTGGMNIVKAVLKTISTHADENRYIQPKSVPIFEILFKTIIAGGAAYGILIIWQVDVTAWLASAGILGIAVGFAAKDTLSNFFSGVFILADAPYKIGDYIVLDSGERGKVTDIGIRSTRLLTRDDIQIIVPNAAIGNTKIVNESGGPHIKERVRISVGVAYGSDIDEVRDVLTDIAAKSSFLLNNPHPRVRFRAFGDSSLNFQLLGWIEEPALRGKAIDELNTAIYKRFLEQNIVIPFPQRDVHLISHPQEILKDSSIYRKNQKKTRQQVPPSGA